MDQTHKSSPRDVFMHLLVTVALYVSAVSFLTLLFQFINVWFPDDQLFRSGSNSSVRWAIAWLVIVYPILVWLSRFLHKDMLRNPWKAELRIRKWLMYLTLSVASGLIAGDLVALIFNFLEGGLTAQFLFKVLAVLIVGVGVFWYYLYRVRSGAKVFTQSGKSFVWATTIAVIAVLIGGFIVAGSPFQERALKIDRERVSDLSYIQGEIINFWQNKDRLPENINELRDDISGFIPPVDPETKEEYTYSVKGALIFELCATFTSSSDESSVNAERNIRYDLYPPGSIGGTWEHPEEFKLLKENKWSELEFEIHLMIEHPEFHVGDWFDAGAKRVVVHVETISDLEIITDVADKHDGEVLISFSPEIPAENFSLY